MVIDNNFLNEIQHSNQVFLSVIPGSDNFHPELSNLVAIYIYSFDTDSSFIIPIDHPESLGVIDLNRVVETLSGIKYLYCIDKKNLLYFLPLKNIRDLKFNLNFRDSDETSYISWMNSKNRNYDEVNKLIPLAKHQERNDNYVKTTLFELVEASWDEGKKFLNDIATPVFFLIEKHGLKVSYQSFIDMFKPTYADFNLRDNITYTSYNMYNVTSRPTNSFNGVNYAAIPKKSDFRKCFQPQNDLFVEFDFDGYHIRLLADQVGYNLTPEPAHKQLARLYFNKSDISDDEYVKAKQINFQALYGHTPNKYKDFEMFKKIEDWTNDLWEEFTSSGYINAPISHKRFSKDIEGMYPKKLLNYIIQAMETARNTVVLKDTLQFLNHKKTKIALYTYDSVLIDFSKEDGKETLEQLEIILSENNRYPVKFKYSNNLVFD